VVASHSYVSPHLHTCLLPLFPRVHRNLRMAGVDVDVGRSDDIDDVLHDQHHDDLVLVVKVNGVVVEAVTAVEMVRVLDPGKVMMEGEGQLFLPPTRCQNRPIASLTCCMMTLNTTDNQIFEQFADVV
jgi:hypothetical protein